MKTCKITAIFNKLSKELKACGVQVNFWATKIKKEEWKKKDFESYIFHSLTTELIEIRDAEDYKVGIPLVNKTSKGRIKE